MVIILYNWVRQLHCRSSWKQTMLSDSSGRRILKEQPNITTEILHMDKLAKLPHNTFGQCHDFYHAITNMPIIIEEITIKGS
ncbi:ATV_HP_G0015010.mRNA.1.CDS.1 [Saccharomyces cerevisiae]|nr:ATV_HP_G0015010.mRNA.1.CDS.1 [Saccharomyces cerevisiae]CAI6949977.1 ATV_HP_G0015010.mRNA.1.CDS.1 [Saccharomyces cerevisiae]